MPAGESPTQPASAASGSVWVDTPNPVRRFIVLFIVYIVPFTILFYTVLIKTNTFDRYLDLNASVSAALLRVLGEEASSTGQALQSPKAALEIRHGCDAILPTALFLSAVLAFPVVMRLKWTALLLGSVGLLTLNLVRIITLYYTRVHKPDWFHAMHVDIWQPAFIFLALLFWVLWALKATKPAATSPAVSRSSSAVDVES